MTRQELELKAKEFDSKLKRHPMSSEELQNVLCDFVEALHIHDVDNSFCDLYKEQCVGNLCSVTPNPEKCEHLKQNVC